MKFSRAAIAATLTALATAAPVEIEKRAAITDVDILNYALTLEHLEATFYAQALKNFTQAQFANQGFNAAFYENLETIASDEATHVSFLTSAIQSVNGTPVAACNYSFPYTDPKSFVALASVLEGVGVSAYLGAARYINNKGYLTDAASVLTVEARHSAFIRNALSEVPFAYPFDTPLDFDEVYTLAAPFILGCPKTNPALPVMAFPDLSVLNATSPLLTGDKIYLITMTGTVLPSDTKAAWASVTGPIFTDVTLSTNGQSAWTTVPAGVSGQSYVVLTKKEKVNDNTIIAGPAIVEVGAPVS